MSDRAQHFKIGVFVIATTSLLVAGVALLGAGSMFEEKLYAEVYMDQSVQGLEVGSPLRFRGVKIGAVKSIHLVADAYREEIEALGLTPEQKVDLTRYVVVELAVTQLGAFERDEMKREQGRALAIEKGLRARLASQGITGVMYVEVDFLDPAAFPIFTPPWQPRHTLIPSAPSTIQGLLDVVEAILAKVESLDVEELLGNLNGAVVSLQRKIDQLPLDALVEEGTRLMTSVRGTVDSLSPELAQLVARGHQVLGHVEGDTLVGLDQAVQQLDDVARAVHEMVAAKEGNLRSELLATVQGLRQATAALTPLLEDVDRSVRRLDRLAAGSSAELPALLGDLRTFSQDLAELGEIVKAYPSLLLLGKQPAPVTRGDER